MTGQTKMDRNFVGPPDLRRLAAIDRPIVQPRGSDLVAKRKAKRLAIARENERARRAYQAAQARAYQAEQARAERMAPLMLEAQRNAILRQNAMEANAINARNAANYERMAGAAERRSGLYTRQNSGIAPQAPQAPPHLQGSPLDP
jgi:hypothetical protein